MADNTAQARAKLDEHRAAVRNHTKKYRDYPNANDKAFAWKTVQNAQV